MAYLPGIGGSRYGGYGGYGGGYGGYGALPELSYRPMDLNAVQQGAQEYQAQQELGPEELDVAHEALDLKRAGYGNDMLAQIADESRAADPADAPGIWDRGMQRLADRGIDGASQYIGHYRTDLAERVSDVFGGRGAAGRATGGASYQDNPNFNQQAAFDAISKMSKEERLKALQNQNAAITGFNSVTDEASWNAELGKLKAAGIPVDQILPQAKDWRVSYALAQGMLNRLTPIRNMLADYSMNEAEGAPNVPPNPMYGKGAASLMGYSVTGYTPDGRPIYTQKGNPANTYIGDAPTGYGAKPSAGMALYEQKKTDALAAGMSNEDAVGFAGGKHMPSDAELHNMAATRANQELGDATLAGQTISDPTSYVNAREAYWYNLYKHPNAAPAGGAPGGGGGAAGGAGARSIWSQMSQADRDKSLANARAAITKNPGSRAAVIRKLQAAGAPTTGL